MINKNDKYLIHNALCMWINYIEIGDVCMSDKDAENCSLKYNALSTDQMKLLIRN